MRSIGWIALSTLLLTGCREDLKDDTSPDSVVDSDVTVDTGTFVDQDGDTYGESTDCDDNDATIHPDADEICDGTDNDCDGRTDEDDATDAPTWYADADSDGYGDSGDSLQACDTPHGYVTAGGDCDDTNATFHPGAIEADCTDPNDYNCDGSVGYADVDADGHAACEDCDDADPNANVDADEFCDGLDNDCDGDIDDEPVDPTTFYADADGDGYGGTWLTIEACEQPTGFVTTANDCDDLDGDSYPGGAEVCDEADNDCDGDVDEGVGLTWYADTDGDGYGDSSVPSTACLQPAGYSANGNDCDDADPSAHPGSFEVCDGTDNDCDGSTDENDAINAATWYTDADGDGFGGATGATTACTQPTGTANNALDCNDTDPAISPNATETCDGADNDCDGTTDESDATDVSTWYADADGDGYGNVNSTTTACAAPNGYTSDTSDCDDSQASVNPAASELCDTLDNDCDGTIDEPDATDAPTWYADTDGDGFGDAAAPQNACSAPSAHVADSTDCLDSDPTVFPAATELCDGQANDCGSTLATTETDDDGDNYVECTLDAGGWDGASTILGGDDCNDASSSISPDATETCNGSDDDCDGTTDEPDATDAPTWYADGDSDGYGDSNDAGTPACSAPGTHYVADENTDCDDSLGTIHPSAAELCDTIDTDCDGITDDDDSTDASTWYDDTDGDGYGDPTTTTTACSAPNGFVDNASDCDPSTSASALCSSCSELVNSNVAAGDGIYTIDLNGTGAFDVYCDMSTDGGGWTLVEWLISDFHSSTSEVSPGSVKDRNTHAKLSDTNIRDLATSGQGQAQVSKPGTTYIQTYSNSSWSNFSSTGWTNESWTSLNSDGSTTTCNGHYNNRGFSTYSDNHGGSCPAVYSGSGDYMVTWHTYNYQGGVGGEFGVYVR